MDQIDTMISSHGQHWLRGRLLGKGCYGKVYLAFSKWDEFSSVVNLPELMAAKSAELPSSQSIRHEAEVMFEINGCPFIIQPFGAEITMTDNGQQVYNLLLEYASGGTLDGMIKWTNGCGLAQADVRDFTRSILEGIGHIHKRGYMHCDLKPENILLVPNPSTRNGCVAKIADFGLARRTNEKCSRWRGTPRYLPPEALMFNKQDESSDIWSLGCIVLEMLTGKSLWDVENCSTVHDFIKLMLDNHVLHGPEIPFSISPVARDFVRCCLAFRAWERSTAEKLLSHPFITQAASSSLAYGGGACWFRPNADYAASSVYEFDARMQPPRMQPPPMFGIPAGL